MMIAIMMIMMIMILIKIMMTTIKCKRFTYTAARDTKKKQCIQLESDWKTFADNF